ncbi:M3 family oligoendopeptidase [Candidatus Cardinium hertigii]|uniref:M3 family oligoendopeptidase n=1 Tax=Candidatus Cardinium hertigii TaxID=247481 RepID=A0A3N2QB71_9BACT|nr:M3 family oligoendopeptidase [Candidatus Cardinium hertigii]ROT47056.1 M3 family oligoendopeptidase [Candidatus Cardinium hertigii]
MQKYTRTFLPLDFSITDWASIQPFYDNLLARNILSLDDLKQLLVDWSELEGALEEDAGWRYIHTTCHTTDITARERYTYYITAIVPHLTPVTDQLHQKVIAAKDTKNLRKDVSFDIFFRKIENNLRCYREENIPIQTDIQLNQQKFGIISAAMVVEVGGKECTLPQAMAHLESTDRPFRKEVYYTIQQRRLQDKDRLNTLYSTLIQQRHQLALNAGFENFRDYAFVAMHRFDYTPQDCFTFHAAIKEEIVPLLNELAVERKQKLGVNQLQPFDHAVDIASRKPLQPFADARELITKTITVFERLDPFLADCLRTMDQMGHLDLTSRKDKAPGGYNYPLDETGVPFIFMNAASTMADVLTMFHEGGHAVHSFLVHKLPLNAFKHCPAEIAELASMSMELLTMPYWNVLFTNQEDLYRAQKDHLIHVISCLPWMATIDTFQHWVYENPYHTVEERAENWNRIFNDFSDNITDWTGYEEVKSHLWQKQLHLFEVPFYYIEYAIAQLGAIGVWKNAQEKPKEALHNYFSALKLGNTASMRTIYQTAGVRFDFSRAHIRSLAQFVKKTWMEIPPLRNYFQFEFRI